MNDENLTIEEVCAHENIDLERGDKLIDDDDHARMLIEEIVSELISDLK